MTQPPYIGITLFYTLGGRDKLTPYYYSLFISVKCSTCFRRYLHPSLGAHITVSIVPGINETVTTTHQERNRMVTGLGATGLGDT